MKSLWYYDMEKYISYKKRFSSIFAPIFDKNCNGFSIILKMVKHLISNFEVAFYMVSFVNNYNFRF